MTYIKRLVMHGFKSFVRKTEIPFTQEINVVLGPNGSGKSNISDALCFVLGRLNIKSMRAAKAKNLIFLGTKKLSPAKEASVELVFDNSEKTFAIDKNELSIKRIVRRNGQSVYKINNEVKTRQEVLMLLSHAGIDPNGFNIVLQGQIQNFVRMHNEERRKIIEEVSGISIYEARKQKALKELEKTENKLGEVSTILRERTAYLNNLEKERQQALRFKKLEKDVKVFKASIINFDIQKKKKEIEKINSEISKKNQEVGKVKKLITDIQTSISNFESKIKIINATIQESTGFEQEKLNKEIADTRAEIEGLRVKSENYENRILEISKKKQELEVSISEISEDIKELQKKFSITKKQKDLDKKKQELEKLEEQRKKFYTTKAELKLIRERLQDKNSLFRNYQSDSEFLLKQIESLSSNLFDKKTSAKKIESLKSSLSEKQKYLNSMNKKEVELEKTIHTSNHEIDKLDRLEKDVSKLDVCPLCKSKITQQHIKEIKDETLPKIKSLNKKIEYCEKELQEIKTKAQKTIQEISELNSEIQKRQEDLEKIKNLNEKKQQLKTLQEKIDSTKKELETLQKKKKSLENNFDENSDIEQKCETLKLEIQEISLRSKENIDSEIILKQGELERSKLGLKQLMSDKENLNEELASVNQTLNEKNEFLKQKKIHEEKLREKFKKLISERDSLQNKIHSSETDIIHKQNEIRNIEEQSNNLKIYRAKFDAERENLETEMLEFQGVEIIQIKNRDALSQKLIKTQETLSRIGSVNLRSLEVYDSVKKEYDSIQEKVELISKEKQGIMKIIHEIDVKKKKTFNKTLDALNEIFSQNFSQLSTKGQVTLELENRKNPFEGGVGISVKTGHGKYFDVTSLSGGEQVLVALSLIFAIQEYSPYHFYILDEIDAALDKRNSERLASLLKKYMKKGQYLIITHNDEVISNATSLYGVSMHDGVSKIVSLKI